jgi:hypothetical protein
MGEKGPDGTRAFIFVKIMVSWEKSTCIMFAAALCAWSRVVVGRRQKPIFGR